jgi:MGT family glycosyltransferase
MSHFLFATLPFAGHTLPALPIAAELVRRGHSVRWYTGARFADRITAIGATHHSMSDYDFSVAELDTFYPERLRHSGIRRLKFDLVATFARPVPTHLADLGSLLDEHPADALVGDTGLLAGPILSDLGGPPLAVLAISVVSLPGHDQAPLGLGLPPSSTAMGRLRNRFLNKTMSSLLFKPMYTEINRIRHEHGLSEVAVAPGYLADADLILQLSTPGSDYPSDDLPASLRHVGPPRPLPTQWERPAWWSELASSAKPVVLVTQGTLTTDHRELLRPTLDALAEDDVMVVAVTGGPDPADLGRLPGNARAARFLPFDEVLPHAHAYVTNGGFGGVQLALSHGVPIVAAGKTEDKADVAARVAYAGVGVNLKTQKPSARQIRTAVNALLADDRYRVAARKVQAEIEAAGREVLAADLLAELARRPAASLARTLS